jgi:hypothetical protein
MAATFRKEQKTHSNAPTDAFHGLTPVGNARRYSDRRCVNSAAVTERGGTQ